jgi:hypothetical protein
MSKSPSKHREINPNHLALRKRPTMMISPKKALRKAKASPNSLKHYKNISQLQDANIMKEVLDLYSKLS